MSHMGRHATPAHPVGESRRDRLRRHLVTWAERVGLGLAAGAVTAAVLRWAGTPWAVCAWVAAAALVVVPAAAWLAATVPGPHHPHDPARPSDEAVHPRG